MTAEIIGAFFIIGFFYILNQVSSGMLGNNHPLSKVFTIGSGILAAFFLGLMFLSE